jgi:hypothetical protein
MCPGLGGVGLFDFWSRRPMKEPCPSPSVIPKSSAARCSIWLAASTHPQHAGSTGSTTSGSTGTAAKSHQSSLNSPTQVNTWQQPAESPDIQGGSFCRFQGASNSQVGANALIVRTQRLIPKKRVAPTTRSGLSPGCSGCGFVTQGCRPSLPICPC